MNKIVHGNKELNIIEDTFLKGTKENHTHVRFHLRGYKTIVSRQMFVHHFPDCHETKKGLAYLIKIEITE